MRQRSDDTFCQKSLVIFGARRAKAKRRRWRCLVSKRRVAPRRFHRASHAQGARDLLVSVGLVKPRRYSACAGTRKLVKCPRTAVPRVRVLCVSVRAALLHDAGLPTTDRSSLTTHASRRATKLARVKLASGRARRGERKSASSGLESKGGREKNGRPRSDFCRRSGYSPSCSSCGCSETRKRTLGVAARCAQVKSSCFAGEATGGDRVHVDGRVSGSPRPRWGGTHREERIDRHQIELKILQTGRRKRKTSTSKNGRRSPAKSTADHQKAQDSKPSAHHHQSARSDTVYFCNRSGGGSDELVPAYFQQVAIQAGRRGHDLRHGRRLYSHQYALHHQSRAGRSRAEKNVADVRGRRRIHARGGRKLDGPYLAPDERSLLLHAQQRGPSQQAVHGHAYIGSRVYIRERSGICRGDYRRYKIRVKTCVLARESVDPSESKETREYHQSYG